MLTIKVRPLILFLAIIGLLAVQFFFAKDMYNKGVQKVTLDNGTAYHKGYNAGRDFEIDALCDKIDSAQDLFDWAVKFKKEHNTPKP